MRHPIPIILTAILLGLLAAFDLLGAAGMAVAGFLILHKGLPGSPTPMPFPPSFLPLLFFGMALVSAAVALWLVFTLIGLVRLRSWARYSVLAVGGLMAGFGGISMAMSLAMPFLAPSVATTPGVDFSRVRIVFLISAAFYGIFTAIGIAWLIYFNLARTRALFLQDTSVSLTPPNTSTGRPRPTAITAISLLYMTTAPFCMIYFFLPFPGFLFGFILYGIAAHLLYASFGLANFVLGYGLYRLRNWARLGIYAIFAVALVNTLTMLTPWGRSQFHAYMDAFGAHMYSYGGQPPPPNLASAPVAIALGAIFGLGGCAVVLWLLHRHRVAFTPAPPPPPMPLQPEPVAGLTP